MSLGVVRMRVEVVLTGQELIEGRRRDINTQILAGQLHKIGLEIARVTMTGDDLKEIIEILDQTSIRADAVIVTGGLGPTVDDRTRDAAAEVFDAPLIESAQELEVLKDKFVRFGRPMSDSNRRQALFPQGASVMPNPFGTACGFYLETRGRLVFFAPGVPSELEMMASDHIVPLLAARSGKQAVESITLRTFGQTESMLDQILQPVALGEVRLAFTASFPEIDITLTSIATSADEAKAKLTPVLAALEEKIGNFIFSRTSQTMEEALAELMLQRGLTIATAESCTGGMVAARLTNVAGSSQWFKEGVVTYSNEAKMNRLGVSREILEQFGAVSAQAAEAMASGIRESTKADLGLSITGIAGPSGGSIEKPVGTVYMALATPVDLKNWHYVFPGNRSRIRTLITQNALDRVRRWLWSWKS